jgi:hypothetical protein
VGGDLVIGRTYSGYGGVRGCGVSKVYLPWGGEYVGGGGEGKGERGEGNDAVFASVTSGYRSSCGLKSCSDAAIHFSLLAFSCGSSGGASASFARARIPRTRILMFRQMNTKRSDVAMADTTAA